MKGFPGHERKLIFDKFLLQEKETSSFFYQKRKKRKRHQLKKLRKARCLAKGENYFESYLNHHHPFKNLTPFVCSLSWAHHPWSQSQYRHVLPPILRAHARLGKMDLIWAMAFIEKHHCIPTRHPSRVQTNKWFLNLDLKFSISLQIKMTSEPPAHRAMTIISWAPNYSSLYYGWSNKSVCSSP